MSFDVIVIGGGHAGVEAAAVAARRGARVALVTMDAAKIGAMSCNPSIGGLGKGHLVREVDAFDGVIGRAADAAAIHYRLLNRSKGAAVRGPRVQADRRLFARAVRQIVCDDERIEVVEAEVAELDLRGDRIVRVGVDGGWLNARAFVLASGTFLGGRIFRGDERIVGGRIEERAATALGRQLRDLGMPVGRLKTGTPPRLDGRTIDWSRFERQPSDRELWTMSPMTAGRALPQLACFIAHTNAATHAIIDAAANRSPMFTGAIEGAGPRYCPSIEDKVRRYPDRAGHQVFLEPEGLGDSTIYPNGISTSLPIGVQEAFVRSIDGLENAVITVPGYAVEYDYVDPTFLDHRFATRGVSNLFLAGQVNGTTGYEEAAAQGLIAGANAAATALELEKLRLDRSTSYLGVLVDDLVLQGVTEPYRMLTARAEYRLSMRADNAETRLGPLAQRLGCLSAERLAHQDRRRAALERASRGEGDVPDEIAAEVAEDRHYAPYVARQAAEIADRTAKEDRIMIRQLDFSAVPGLSTEMIARLVRSRPETLGQASRVRGITPAALSAIFLQAKRSNA